MTMNRSTSLMLAGSGLVLMIGAHGLVAWGGITLGEDWRFVTVDVGGALAFGLPCAAGIWPVLTSFSTYAAASSRPPPSPCRTASDVGTLSGPRAASS